MTAKNSADYCRANSGAKMVDTASVVTYEFLLRMQEIGVKTIARYYDYENETLPNKRLRDKEVVLLRELGFRLLVIFQHNNNKSSTFENWKTRGPEDAARCLELSGIFGQPENSAIYFGVDGDFFGNIPGYPATHLSEEIFGYFDEILNTFSRLNAKYKVGVYGGGACINALKKRSLVDFRWLSHSHGFVGSKNAFLAGEYEIEQYLPGQCGGRSIDFNNFRSESSVVGDFSL